MQPQCGSEANISRLHLLRVSPTRADQAVLLSITRPTGEGTTAQALFAVLEESRTHSSFPDKAWIGRWFISVAVVLLATSKRTLGRHFPPSSGVSPEDFMAHGATRRHVLSITDVAFCWNTVRLLKSYKPRHGTHGQKSPDRQWPPGARKRGCEMLQAWKKPHFLECVDSLMINKKAARCEMHMTTGKSRENCSVTSQFWRCRNQWGFLFRHTKRAAIAVIGRCKREL